MLYLVEFINSLVNLEEFAQIKTNILSITIARKVEYGIFNHVVSRSNPIRVEIFWWYQ